MNYESMSNDELALINANLVLDIEGYEMALSEAKEQLETVEMIIDIRKKNND